MTEKMTPNSSETTNEFGSTFLLSKSELIDDKFSNLVLNEHQKCGQITPQLIEEKKKANVFPTMLNGKQFLEEKEGLD